VGVFYKSENVENLGLPASKRAELFARYAVSKLPPFNRYVGAKLMVDLSELANIGKDARLEKVYFLERGRGESVMAKRMALNRMVASTMQSFFDHYLSNKMFYAYCYITGFDPGYIEHGMRGILESAVKGVSVIRSDKKDFHKYLRS
jgi:hypothetical protein